MWGIEDKNSIIHLFHRLKSLATGFNDSPELASRPFARDRCGFVVGEGCGVLILEEYERAKARGAKIYCEIAGYGLSCKTLIAHSLCSYFDCNSIRPFFLISLTQSHR